MVHIALRLGMSRSTLRFVMTNKGFTIPRYIKRDVHITESDVDFILKSWPGLNAKRLNGDSRVASKRIKNSTYFQHIRNYRID